MAGKTVVRGFVIIVSLFAFGYLICAYYLSIYHDGMIMKQSKNVLKEQIISSNLMPNMAFYVWCGRRLFEFNHYLSVMSILRILRPDKITFFYDEEPEIDDMHYNTWFEELKHDYPFIELSNITGGCRVPKQAKLEFIHMILSNTGGFYVNETLVLSEFPMWYKNYSLVEVLAASGGLGMLMAQRYLSSNKTIKAMLKDNDIGTSSAQCATVDHFNTAEKSPLCVTITDQIFPKEIWDHDSPFGRLARHAFYGSPDINKPIQDFSQLVPNIAHVVWIGGGEMDLIFYLCVLSLLYVAEVDMVYIHGDEPPTGPYWVKVKDLEKLTYVYRPTLKTVYQNRVGGAEHKADVLRVECMIEYGGIYVDTDVIFVKPLDKDIRAYDAVVGYDWLNQGYPFPEYINAGIMLGKRNATFWRMYMESFRWHLDTDWLWNSGRQPYRIKERHPGLVFLHTRLQVMCYLRKCHPTWWPVGSQTIIIHVKDLHSKNTPLDWKNDAYAFHWTYLQPGELRSMKTLLSRNTMFSEIGRYILQKSGVIKT